MLPAILAYDGRCGFCRRSVLRWKARTGTRVLYLPLLARRSVVLLEPSGSITRGAEAVLRALGRAPGLGVLPRLPGLRVVGGLVYRFVARHRSLFGAIDRALFGRRTTTPSSALVRSVFVRGMGAVYLAAFTSLGAQVLGLYGRRGILPIDELLQNAKAVLGRDAWKSYPSIFLAGASDEALVRAVRAGQALSIALMLGVAPRATLAALWVLYLSFVSTGRDFLSFQWDVLLLESSVPAILIAPTGVRPALRGEEPPWTAVLLMRWYAARFFYEAGIAKVRSGDETWRTRTACCYHYQTQPLPTPLAWQAHGLPRRLQKLSTRLALAVEIYVPFLAVAPRRVRRLGFFALAGLQALIAATGNYGFFNALSIVLSLWYVDESPARRPQRTSGVRRFLIGAGSIPLFAATLGAHVARYGRRSVPHAVERLIDLGQRARSLGVYGLFASMTKSRPEIVVEGSNDGTTWRPYSFRYKPGDPRRGPRWIAPHQPRLDWQMWFAALGPPPRWFLRFLQRLLEGSPEVLALLERAPFGERPPRYVRALLYNYLMTDRNTRKRTGEWWHRELLGLYVPPIALAPERQSWMRPST